MLMFHRIIRNLETRVEKDERLAKALKSAILKASWTPPGWHDPIENFEGFYAYLDQLMSTSPADATFDNMFHGIYYIISQNHNELQIKPEFAGFQEWLALFVEIFGSILNTPQSANNLASFLDEPAFNIGEFMIDPGGFNNFNTFFARHIKPGKRPIGTLTHPYEEPSPGHPLDPNLKEDPEQIFRNMCDDSVITVPADSVYKGSWLISEQDTITVSKGNTYSIEELLADSRYRDDFKGGLFTHSYLTVYTYHRYHVPVRGIVKETMLIEGKVYAEVVKKHGDLGATDKTGYQFKQDRGLIVLDSPVGLVALLPIGMDFISSVNITVDKCDYLNKGDEFGYFLFGGSDMIMLFENRIEVKLPKKGKLYKLGQVFGTYKKP